MHYLFLFLNSSDNVGKKQEIIRISLTKCLVSSFYASFKLEKILK